MSVGAVAAVAARIPPSTGFPRVAGAAYIPVSWALSGKEQTVLESQ